MDATPTRVRDNLDTRAFWIAIFVMATLGGSHTMVKVGLRDLPVFGSMLLRALVAALFLGGYALWTRVPIRYSGRAVMFLMAQTAFFSSRNPDFILG